MENEDELVRMIKRELGADEGFEDAESIPLLGKQLLVTTDMLTEGDDFPPGMPYDAIGWKAVTASLSDLAAAGAKPLGMTMAWGLPRVMPSDGARQIAKGMAKCARAHKTRVYGGDLNEGESITLCGTAFGVARYPLRRGGAKPGDLLAVTGPLGASSAGYLLYWSKKERKTESEERMLRKFNYPEARVSLMADLNSRSLVRAATDISDGFSSAVRNICEGSNAGALVEYVGVPMEEGFEEFCEKNRRKPFELLNLGCDYEIVAAFPQECFSAAKRIAKAKGCDLYEIGTVLKQEQGILLEKDGKLMPLPKEKYSHFD
ncbi:MAG: thiamine-phosphate kinase [Candidatus Micrarchaeia archaeon]